MQKMNNYFDTKWLILAVAFTAIVILCTHIPQELMPSQLQKRGLDKLQHIVAYGTITFLFVLSLKNPLSLLSAFLLFFATLAIGIFDEVTQPLVSRQASLADLVANVIGILTALLLSMVGKYRCKKTNTE
jgi:VanZ family protein